MSAEHEDLLGKAIVQYATTGKYLDADLALPVERQMIRDAYQTITSTKAEAEDEIRDISRNYSEHVDAWIKHADSLQKDIESSKSLGGIILQTSEEAVELERVYDDARAHAGLLRKEITYNELLLMAMKNIKSVIEDIQDAERYAREKETMKAIRLLSEALRSIHSLPNFHRVRAYTLLEQRALSLEATLLTELDEQWQALVQVDVQGQSLTITEEQQNLPMTLRKTLVALRHLDQLDLKAKEFDRQVQDAIFKPRISAARSGSSGLRIVVKENKVKVSQEMTNPSTESLLSDVELAITFIVKRLPEFSSYMAETSLSNLCVMIRDEWLEPLIDIDINHVEPLTEAIQNVKSFVDNLQAIGWTQTEILKEWIDDCARLWITKRKETDLVYTRDQLSHGLRSQRTIVKQQETQLPHSSDAVADEDAWDQGWSDEEGEATKPSTTSLESQHFKSVESGSEKSEDGDAWGWNDEDTVHDNAQALDGVSAAPSKPARSNNTGNTMLILKWKYLVSSMPEGVLDVLQRTIEDGLSLSQPEYASHPAAPAAMAMFGLPTLILAMYRTASPYYYSMVEAGNMYLYNDALWLAEQLDSLSNKWPSRPEVTPRLANKVKYGKEVETLEKLGKRAYAKEIATQRTIIKDMLRGDQCFLLDEGINIEEDENAIDIVASHIRHTSKTWEMILARQNWAQAVGALLATVANKIVTDILEISGLEADASYNIAKLIARVVELEDLYTISNSNETAEFAGLQMQASECVGSVWFKLQYLSEILQSNLDSLRFLWFEGEASMFYSASEMIDLIELSFAESSRREDITRKIRANPRPRPDL